MGSLESIANLEAGQKRAGYLPRYTSVFPMALIPYADSKGRISAGVVREKGEPLHSVGDDVLEEVIKELGGTDEHAKDVVKAKYSSYALEQLDKNFIDSGKYNRLADWCYNNGLKVPEKIRYYESVKRDDGAVAWTKPGEQTTGIDSYIDEKVAKLSSSSGITKDQAIELLLTHEYMHNSKDASPNDNVYLVESGNELNLAEYFYHTALTSKDDDSKKHYLDLTNVCLGRYLGIMASYLKQQGADIELDEETINGLLEDSGFIDYAKSQAQDNQEQDASSGSAEESAEYSKAA